MGILNFFSKIKGGSDSIEKKQSKSTKSGIPFLKFNSQQFQAEVGAIAMCELKENNNNPSTAIYELQKMGLNKEQIDEVLNKARAYNKIKDEREAENKKETIDVKENVELFESDEVRRDILEIAKTFFSENNQDYSIVKEKLSVDLNLNENESNAIIEELKVDISKMVEEFKEELNSGRIAELKIHPNSEHTKDNVDSLQVDKYIGYGIFQMDRGDFDNALELFDKAIELDDKASLAYANKGKLYTLKNEKERGLDFYNKALELDPNNEAVLDNKVHLVFALFTENKIDEKEFINSMKEILQIDPNSPNAALYVIQFYLKNKDIPNALLLVKKIFKTYYRDQQITHVLLDTLARLPEKQALAEFDVIESEVGEDAKYQLYYNKGLYLKGIGKYDAAIELYLDLNKVGEFSWNYYQIAIMQNLQGQERLAIENLKRTFELEPGLKDDAKQFPQLQNLWNNPMFIQITT